MAKHGIDVHVFVLALNRCDIVDDKGVTVHHILHKKVSHMRRLASGLLHILGLAGLDSYYLLKADSLQAAKYISNFCNANPLNVLQFTDYMGVGLTLCKQGISLLVARCSSAIDLYMKDDQRFSSRDRAQIKAEQQSIVNSDVIISPSQLVADHYRRLLGRDVIVVPPPAYLESPVASSVPDVLPSKYLVHYAGWLIPRKGSDLVLDALPLALEICPDIKVVMIGNMTSLITQKYNSLLSCRPESVIHLSPVSKSCLYAIVKKSQGAILPSRVDNTPNTLIEALLLNVHVIVSRDSSLDDLVEGYSKAFVMSSYSPQVLASLMVKAWSSYQESNNVDAPWLNSKGGIRFRPDYALKAHFSALGLLPQIKSI